MAIKLSRNLSMPDEAVTYKMGLVGRTGTGKTNTAVLMAEQMIELGYPIVVLDPQGDWWGLRSKYQIAILGGEHGDIPLDARAGQTVAEFVIAHRHPVLLDLFGMGEGEMVRFATDFAKQLWKSNREALHIFLDEADLFAPQKTTGTDKAKCLSAWQNIVRRGRSKGLGCTMISQRPAVINKDLFTQADPLFVHRLTASQDLGAIDKYLDFYGYDKPQRREQTAALAKLKLGEALVLSPGTLSIEPKLVSIGKRKSFDSSATPEAGQTQSRPRKFAQVDLSALKEQMATTIEEAEANDPKRLKKRITELEREIKQQRPEVDEVRIAESAAAEAIMKRDQYWMSQLNQLASEQSDAIESLKRDGLENARKFADGFGSSRLPAPIRRPNRTSPINDSKATNLLPKRQFSARASTNGQLSVDDEKLGKCETSCLQALYWLKDEAATKAKVSFYAGYSIRSGSFNNAMSRLRTLGLVSGWKITPSGEELIGPNTTSKPLGPELREWLRPKLGKCENAVLDTLICGGGEAFTNEEIAEGSGYSAASGSFNNALSRLRSLEAVEGYEKTGGTKAAAVFFE